MRTSAQIISLDALREQQTRGSSDSSEVPRARMRENREPTAEKTRPELLDESLQTNFDVLYPLGGAADALTENALRLLEDAFERANEAVEALREGNAIASDDGIQRIGVLLPELFATSTQLTDGFRAVVLGLFHCIKNADAPLTEPQLLAVRQAVQTIRRSPYLTLDAAIDLQEKQEAAGLDPDAAAMSNLGDLMAASD